MLVGKLHRLSFARKALSGASGAIIGAGSIIAAQPLMAQTTISVPTNSNLNIYSPVNGDIWNLQGNAFLSDNINTSAAKALPSGTPGLTINGVAGISTITLNDSANHYGYFSGSTTTFNLSNVTIIGGRELLGGAINTSNTLTLNTSGTVSFNGNTATGIIGGTGSNGGALYAGSGNIVVNGSISMDGNIATAYGGAIAAISGNVSVATTNGNVSLTNNISAINGGAVFANNDLTVGNSAGTVTITGNKAGFNANGTQANSIAGGGGLNLNATGVITVIGNAITISNNVASGFGGGVRSNGALVITGNLTANSNKALTGSGGALYANTGSVTVNGNVSMDSNSAVGPSATLGSGGAIRAVGGGVDLATGSGSISLTNNTAAFFGGAISAGIGTINIGNGSATVTITGNRAGFNDSGTQVNATSHGGAISGNGSTTITGGVITLSDNVATLEGGAVYSAAAFTLNANGATMIANNTAGSKGGAVYVGGNVTLNAAGGDMTFTGNRHGGPVANAIYLNNTGGGKTATFNADAGRTITFFDPVVNNATNGLVAVNKTGAGMVSFDGSKYSAAADRWSQVYGTTTVSAGTFEIANNAVYGALAADVSQTALSSFTSAAGTMVQGGAAGTLRADAITLNGNLSIAGQQSGTRGVFNVYSNNVTLGGGTIFFNTYLNDGVAQNTDLLVLNLNGSATSGQSLIQVTNIGGPGQLTVGDGIKLVQTNNGTTAGAFVLGNRVAAGAYEYYLFYGGQTATGGNADDQNWYLRNQQPIDPTNPDSPVVPIIRPEVAVDMVIPPLAMEYGYAMLDTLHERVGETWVKPATPVYEEKTVRGPNGKTQVVRVPVAAANGADQTKLASSGWARLIGERGFRNSDSFLRHGPDYNYTFGGLQAGLDIYGREKADGTLDKAGFYVGIGNIQSDVKGAFGGKAGTVDMDAYTVGGYWTHFAPQGWYTDAVMQGTWYSADAKSIYGQQIKPEGFGIIASLEGGYAFKLGNNWTLEPQAQLAYQSVSFDSARDQFGFVSFDDGESMRGRFGLRLTKAWDVGEELKPHLITSWLRANVWHEFLGNAKTAFGSFDGQTAVPFSSSLGGTWGEIGAGVSGQVTDNTSLFATAAYNRSLDNKGRETWDGRLGITVKW